ncbi:MAG: hypothetical protein AAF357_11545 [Verrucomicrobiota bacterium]
MFKTVAHQHFDFSEYDWVFGMDCDLLAVADVNPIFREFEGSLRLSQTEKSLEEIRAKGHRSFDRYLPEAEWDQLKSQPGLNSGHFQLAGADLQLLSTKWLQAHMEAPSKPERWADLGDQQSLNYLFRRNRNALHYFPNNEIFVTSSDPEFNLKSRFLPEGCRIVHFSGKKTPSRLRGIYEHYFALTGRRNFCK